jgi:hypothetical protein
METRRLLIHSVLTVVLVLAPGMGRAGDGKGKPTTPLSISTGSRAERIKAIQALGRSKNPQAIDVLIKELSIMDDGIVAALKTSLRALKAVPVLEQRLAGSGSSDKQKVLACIGLRALKEKSSIPPLISALKDQSAGVRKEAALALGVIAPAEAEAELLTALSDSDEDVRYFAADALGDVHTAAVRQAIETRMAVETSPVVRSALMAARNKLERAPGR